MIYFLSDYSQGAHPRVLEALSATNLEHTPGYGEDRHCEHASEIIRELTGDPSCAVHLMVGGTSCNLTLIAAALRPYESVLSAKSGHIYSHETGAIEATGHRIAVYPSPDGKLTPAAVEACWKEYQDEHTLLPRLVYISQPTELGTVYTKSELTALSDACRKHGMFLYADGARLGSALTCAGSDLTLRDMAALCDAFYIGGTKNGALFGEALVISNPGINDHFRWMMKRQGGLLAKGRLIGVQFEALLEGGENSLFFSIAAHANRMAALLREGLTRMGVRFAAESPTNQVFPILPEAVLRLLEKDFAFYRWETGEDGDPAIRLVTGWGTGEEEIHAFLDAVRQALTAAGTRGTQP